jgi:hypothetical protein
VAERISYEVLLAQRLEHEPDWDPELQWFDVRSYARFAITSRLFPPVVEEPWWSTIKRMASRRTNSKLELKPREMLKSSHIKTWSAWALAHPDRHVWGPQIRICVGSETGKFAKRTTQAVKKILESHPAILAIHPGGLANTTTWAALMMDEQEIEISPEWSQEKFRTRLCILAEISGGRVNEEPNSWPQGAAEASTGRRFDVLFWDDPVGLSTYKSDVKKARTRATFEELSAQASANSLTCVYGTRWADDDIHNTIISEYAQSFDIKVESIWSTGPQLTRDHFQYNHASGLYTLKEAPPEGFTLLWDGFGQIVEDAAAGGIIADPVERRRRALNAIVIKMHKMGPASFARQMENRCVSVEDQIFFPEQFIAYEEKALQAFPTSAYVLTDSASGKDFRSSYRVVALVAFDSSDNAYVRDLEFGYWTPDDYSKRMVSFYKRYGARAILMENVAHKVVFQQNLELVCRLNAWPIPRVITVSGISLASKPQRIEGLQPRFHAGRIKFASHLREKMCDDRKVWDETVRQFCSLQDLESAPKLKLDVPDALSLMEALDNEGRRICTGPARSRAAARVQPTATPTGFHEHAQRNPRPANRRGLGGTQTRGLWRT